jgi:hypothetical protein
MIMVQPTARRRLTRCLAALLLVSLLPACETGPEVVSNAVNQCIAHVRPLDSNEPFCRCLGRGLEQNFTYAQIRQYRLKTENWTFFNDVADDEKLMAINRRCQPS